MKLKSVYGKIFACHFFLTMTDFLSGVRQKTRDVLSVVQATDGQMVQRVNEPTESSSFTPDLSRLTPHTSHLTPHTSHLTPHTSHLTPHTSHLYISRISFAQAEATLPAVGVQFTDYDERQVVKPRTSLFVLCLPVVVFVARQLSSWSAVSLLSDRL
jgi:hypothetical protein